MHSDDSKTRRPQDFCGDTSDNKATPHDIMGLMWRIIAREIWVLRGGLSMFVGLLLVALAHADSLYSGLKLLYRGVFSGALLRRATIDPAFLIKVLSPYLIIQVLRAYRWSQRNITGRRWANVYFVVLLACLGSWSLWSTWDMFSFMYAMGDVPAELRQFFSLESGHILVSLASFALAAHCLRIALRPGK